MKRFVPAVVTTILLGSGAWANVDQGLSALDEGRVSDAAQSFQDAYEAGDADGAFYLGRLVELGIGTEPDLRRAAQLYQLGADGGSAPAQNRLGLMYINGTPMLKDFVRGTELVCLAAEAGDANGQFNCGVSYAEGLGVEADAARARALWEQAAEQDHIAAMNFIGQSLASGDEADPQAALSWFERTARLGNPMGLFEAARLYADGVDGQADLVQAYAYANLAAARLHPEAAAFRDRLEAQMSADEVVEAQSLSRDWQAEEPGAPSDAGQ